MNRIIALMPRVVVVATLGAMVVLSGGMTAEAQYLHGSHGGHWDYQPGHYDLHGDHFDYHPGQYRYHHDSHDDHHTYYVQPRYEVRRPVYESHDLHRVAPTTRRVVTYDFGGFSHVDRLAQQLESEANLVCLELHYNYQHNPGFQETYREAYEVLTTAKFIHGLEHSGNRDRMKESARELDALFHHVQDDVASWTAHHHRHVSPGGLTSKLENLEETLHHLMDDVGVRSGTVASAAPAVAAPAGQIAPPAITTKTFAPIE